MRTAMRHKNETTGPARRRPRRTRGRVGLTVRNIDVRTTGRGQAAVKRNLLPAAELAKLSPYQLRQRRRVGVDTARQQRRRIQAHRRAQKAA